MSTTPVKPEVETDPRFPSGPWTGFWLQRCYAGRQWMSLWLTFADGRITGDGEDRVGPFLMAGTYDLRTGKCSIVKAYKGAHTLSYEGANAGDGLWIWGVWRMPVFDRGGFHMWPADQEDPTAPKLRAAKEAPEPENFVPSERILL